MFGCGNDNLMAPQSNDSDHRAVLAKHDDDDDNGDDDDDDKDDDD